MRMRLIAVVAALLPGLAFCQGAGYDSFYFRTHVGSFKLLSFNESTPSDGKLTLSFSGTILITGFDGPPPVITGAVRKEYDNPKYKKQAYFGTGTITLAGKIKTFQWFGRDLKGSFQGKGVFRLYGEYDKNLETGWFRYGPDVKEQACGNNLGWTHVVPMPGGEQMLKPVARDS